MRFLKKWITIPRRSFCIEWDKKYGPNCRNGWSITFDGSTVVQFQRWLIVAFVKTWWRVATTFDEEYR